MKVIFSFILMAAFCLSLTAQTVDKKEINKKLKELKGDVKEITIKTDDKNVTFEGKEAEYLLKKIKEKATEKKFKFYVTDDEFGDFNCIDLSEIGCSAHSFGDDSLTFSFKFDEDCEPGSSMDKRIEIKLDGDDKIITVTTKKDGKEEVKTYTGKEADEFLKTIDKGDMTGGKKKIIMKKFKDKNED
ncbi:MAG: hypothetical protein V1773_12140 [bacterium]